MVKQAHECYTHERHDDKFCVPAIAASEKQSQGFLLSGFCISAYGRWTPWLFAAIVGAPK
jgi:hypothetical protein